MIIVDSHCHLNFPELSNRLEEIVNSASSMDVKYLQTICTKLEQMPALLKIANSNKNIFSSVGVHPCEVEKDNIASFEEILEYTKHEKVIGIGETGLDLYHDFSKLELQINSFITHIKVARETNLPVIIHTRDAEEETLKVLTQEIKKGEFKALIHCFTASKDFARKVLDLGLYISFSGIITFKNAKELQQIAKWVPETRILVETDAPYLAPVPKRGTINEPSYTKYIVEFLAELRNQDIEKMAEITTNNFFNLFTKA